MNENDPPEENAPAPEESELAPESTPTPEESAPEESAPEESAPEESAPEESAPEESAPEESAPEESAPEESAPAPAVSDKDFVPTVLLCLLLGVLGIHRFYVGKNGSGVAMLLTCGGLGIWTTIDLIMIILGNFTDADGLPIKNKT